MARLPGATGVRDTSLLGESAKEAINGPRVFVATEIVDIGWRRNNFERGPEPKPPFRAFMVRGYIDVSGRPQAITKDDRISGDPKSNLIQLVTAARGGIAPGVEEAVDPGEIIGRPMSVQVSSNAKRTGEGFWLSFKGPAALIEGTPVPASLRQFIREPDAPFAPFRWKTEEEIEREYEALTGGKPATASAPAPGSAPKAAQEQPQGAPVTPAAPNGARYAIAGSQVTQEAYDTLRPVLVDVVDRRFRRDLVEMRKAIEEVRDAPAGEANPDELEAAAVALEWVALNETGDVKLRFRGKTDADADAFRAALGVLEGRWLFEEAESHEDAGDVSAEDLL